MVGTHFLSDSMFKMPSIKSFLLAMASTPVNKGNEHLINRQNEASHHQATFVPSLENMNLFPAAPHRTATGSPINEVLNTVELYFRTRSLTNLSAQPSQFAWVGGSGRPAWLGV
ncbi:hypothetical protein CRG98_046612 [Punica granatum]|uniref:Uncharacterized protein n=1 Tax=Punica granatum TaxID=22663 RepID=A0A2I0HML9_PUNGR|nr:hypothetical protein CRG98_046612 [Punica granatum]